MTYDPDSLRLAIARVRSELLQEAIDHGGGRSPDRHLWIDAQAGWIPVRMLDGGGMAAERKAFSRLLHRLAASGQIETRADSGRITHVRWVYPPGEDPDR
ncbi:MAG: hypothetical protein GXY58_12385 [Planctomycetaceae bacterium]|nr:hypothetical protein [Planctomycetaceae bacterium]